MPLLRYFIYVGGALMALLFVAASVFPEPPALPHRDVARPVIRIASDKVAPPRIEFDTRVQTAAAVAKPVAGMLPQLPARVVEAQAYSPLPIPAAVVLTPAVPGKSGIRNAIRKLKVARRPDRRLMAGYPQVVAYSQTFQPLRLTR